MKEELKREFDNNIQNRSFYNVYKTSNGLYITKELCEKYNIGNENESKKIKDNLCFLVTEKDIEEIQQKSKDDSIKLLPNFVTIFDLQLVLSFNVYVDIKHDNKLYISEIMCKNKNIESKSKRMINKIICSNVTEEDLDRIERQSINEKIRLKRKYIEVDLENEIEPAEHLFIIYTDIQKQKKYIDRKMYELLKHHEIEIEGTPVIIHKKNCYSITENQLKEIENKIKYRGIEQIIKPSLDTPSANKEESYDENIKAVANKIYEFNERKKLFELIKPYNNQIVRDDIRPYLDRIKPVLNKEIIKPYINTIEEKPIIIYKDLKNNNIYIPTDTEQATITIMHKPCRQLKKSEIKKLKKKAVIASVYIIEKEEHNILICDNNGQLFISRSVLADLGFYLENPYRIMINKEIYEEISKEDLELIKNLDSDSCHINITIKQIAPKRG